MKTLANKIRYRLQHILFGRLVRHSDLDTLYAQFSGLLQIQNAMEGKPVLRPMRGWALSPDAMMWILADLQERPAPTVIEFGSGQSTIILAAALKHRNGRFLSVENDPEYSALIQRQVAAWGLTDQVQFVHAPLCDTSDEITIRSYQTSALPDISADIVLVDGPPYENGTFTRLHPLRWAVRHLKPLGAIFLDDSARDFEQACLKQLATEYPNLRITHRIAEKGLAELRLPMTS
jgi:predicted O-methyltransferase YrrM